MEGINYCPEYGALSGALCPATGVDPSDPDHLVKNVRGFLRGRQRRPHKVKKYFSGKQVRYAAHDGATELL
jgi:hypothetical protein